MTTQQQRVIIFGGSGFVGTHIAKALCESTLNTKVVCVSRTGTKPRHLDSATDGWANAVCWLPCDINGSDAPARIASLVADADVVITAVGSPPLPTFSQSAYDAQYRANGLGNITLLETCANVRPKHIIIVSAAIPRLLQRRHFAYYRGKQEVIRTAETLFAKTQTQVSILYPSVIYGRRHTQSGRPVPLGALRYLSRSLQCLPHKKPRSLLASVAALAPIAVDTLAQYCVDLLQHPHTGDIHHVTNQAMLDGRL